MIKIELDIVKSFLSQYISDDEELKAFSEVVRSQILDSVQINMMRIARQELNSTKNIYINSISRTDDEISLEGYLANAIEEGSAPFDMKEGFRNSPKVKINKQGGWYLTIPFRINTPNAPQGTRMPREIYQAIKNGRKPKIDMPLGERPQVSDPATGRIWEMYRHKSSIFEGIQRTSHNAETNRSTYGTFRRVSNNSDPNSWINRGIKAHNIIDKAWAATDIEKIINDGVDIFLD